jgi:hypothetical protein
MTPYDIQNKFISTLLNDNLIENKNIKIYQELISFRFNEVLKSTFPIFTNYIDTNKLEYLIKEFISYGSKTPYVWMMALEFKEFLNNQKDITLLEKQILYFELKQITIYVDNSNIRVSKISYKKSYRLSKNCAIIVNDYDILNQTFNKQKQYILIYKNKLDYQVYHLEISKFLYYFFKYQKGNNSIKKAIYFASKRSNIEYKDAINIAKDTIENFINDGILV